MLPPKSVCLELQEPARNPHVGVLLSTHPLQGGLICNKTEFSPKQVVSELAYSPLDGEALLLYRGVVLFVLHLAPADEGL